MILKDFPIEELPREKVLDRGVDCLSNVELIAILLRTGTKNESVLSLSQQVLNDIGGIGKLREVDYFQLTAIKGIKKAKAVTLLAAIELTKRLMVNRVKVKLDNPRDIYNYIVNEVLFENREKLYLICLNTRLELLKSKLISIGASDMTLFPCNEIVKEALICGSKRIVVIHNHPSGDARPSIEDIDVTNHLMDMCKKMDIDCIDHIIIGDQSYYSFADKRVIDV